jgi:hypothetical protein
VVTSSIGSGGSFEPPLVKNVSKNVDGDRQLQALRTEQHAKKAVAFACISGIGKEPREFGSTGVTAMGDRKIEYEEASARREDQPLLPIAAVRSCSKDALVAAAEAGERGLITPLLVGPKERIRRLGIAVAVVLFATFFPESPASAGHRFRRQAFVHLSDFASAHPCSHALRCYQLALLEQFAATLARVKDAPRLAHECWAGALAALSAAQAIGRLRNAIDGTVVAPGIVAEGSRLLARLSQTLRRPSVWKFSRRAGEARALARHAFALARDSAKPQEIEALNGVVVGSATLGCDLMHARMVLKGKSNAIPI